MDTIYYRDSHGAVYEFEASTNAGIFAWFRRLDDDESVRLEVARSEPLSTAEALRLLEAA